MQPLQKYWIFFLGRREAVAGPARAFPGTLMILEWVTRSCMTSMTGTAAELETFNTCTHKHTPYMACGMSGRGQGTPKCCMRVRNTPPSVTDYQESGYGHWGWEISEPSLLLWEKSTLSHKLLLPGMSGVYLPHEEVCGWQMPVSKPYRVTHGHSGPFRRRWQTCRKAAQCAVAAPLAGCSN